MNEEYLVAELKRLADYFQWTPPWTWAETWGTRVVPIIEYAYSEGDENVREILESAREKMFESPESAVRWLESFVGGER